MRVKKYVNVSLDWLDNGKKVPKSVSWTEDNGDVVTYEIDRVLSAEPRASLKVGGAGMRYHVRIGGHETYIFLEDTKWFVEYKANGTN